MLVLTAYTCSKNRGIISQDTCHEASVLVALAPASTHMLVVLLMLIIATVVVIPHISVTTSSSMLLFGRVLVKLEQVVSAPLLGSWLLLISDDS